MARPECAVCALPDPIRMTVEDADDTTGRTAAAQAATAAGHPITDYAVRVHRKHRTAAPRTDHGPVTPQTGTPEDYKPHVELGPEGGTIATGALSEPLKDPADALALLNVDPTVWELVGDTVRISRWQTPYRDSEGEMTARWSHALRANIRRRTEAHLPAAAITAWRKQLLKPSTRKPLTPNTETTYIIAIADPQLGKKGTDEAVQNWRKAVNGHIGHIRDLAKLGQAPAGIHIAFMGDEHENVVNSYTNQPHTIEMNRSEQLQLDFDLRVWTIREALHTGLPVTASSVVSNHGEWTRNASKDPVTSRNDNSSTYVARQVQRLFDELAPHTGQHVTWTIGDTTPGIVVELSGEQVYFTHGYVEKGRGGSTELRAKGAIERQILGSTARLGSVRVYVFAHYHHFYCLTFEGRTVLGCPALEAERSSEYMLDQYGVWSVPGALGFVVGAGLPMGWNSAAIL